MATGKQIGEYSVRFTTFTFTPGPAGAVLIQGNVEGNATGGFGAVFGTATFIGGPKGGSLSYCGLTSGDDGTGILMQGTGNYEEAGQNKLRTQLLLQLSDGRTIISEGDIDLSGTSRSWNGRVSERN
jgi:hypothetical protein